MKFCPYCGAQHARRGKYCDPAHAKRAGAQLSAASRQRNSARRRVLAIAQERARYNGLWRQLAMGIGEGTAALAIIFDPATRRKRAKRLRAANPADTLTRQK